MFVRITVCLLNSHRSTFGRPVTPAGVQGGSVGLTASISAATASLFSKRASPRTTSSPAALMSSINIAIQPFLP